MTGTTPRVTVQELLEASQENHENANVVLEAGQRLVEKGQHVQALQATLRASHLEHLATLWALEASRVARQQAASGERQAAGRRRTANGESVHGARGRPDCFQQRLQPFDIPRWRRSIGSNRRRKVAALSTLFQSASA